jgi:hypothetical protein
MARVTDAEIVTGPGAFLRGAWPLVLVACLPGSAAAADYDAALAAALRACASVSDAGDRLACFDTLAEELGVAAAAQPKKIPVAPAAAATAAAASEATPPLDDAVGKERIDDDEEEPESWSGRVTSCEKSEATNRWYFHFDNGQVWRQSNAGRLTFRECEFDVTVERDLFGFKLAIPSMDKSVRVARVR